MRSTIFYTTFFLLFLTSSTIVLAGAGLILPPKDQRIFFFEPGASYDYTWQVTRSDSLTTYLEGNLAEYGTLYDDNQGGGSRDVRFTFTLPDELEPGEHTIALTVREEGGDGGMISARAASSGVIRIISLYPDPFIEATIHANTVSKNSTGSAYLEVTSWSEVDISSIYANLRILNSSDSVVLATQSSRIDLAPQEKKGINIPLDTKDLPQGFYRIDADVFGAQEGVKAQNGFRIGAQTVELLDYPNRMTPGRLNKFTFSIRSEWSGDMDLVNARVILDDLIADTPPIDLKGFHSGDLTTYLDLTKYNESENATLQGEIQVFIPGSNTMIFPIEVALVTEIVPETVVEEQPGMVFEFNTITGLYVILLLLVVVNLAFLLKKKKRDD